MTYQLYKKRQLKTIEGHFNEYIGDLRCHPFMIWILGIELGMIIMGYWILWCFGVF
jgi:hypothetical protein